MISKKLKEIDEQLAKAGEGLSLLKYLTVLNLAKERQCFFNDQKYEPVFKYKLIEKKQIIKKISEIENIGNISSLGFLGEILERKRQELIKKGELILSISTPVFFKRSIEYYGFPSKQLVEKSRKIIKNYDRKIVKKSILTKREIKEEIKKTLAKYQLKELKIEFSGNNSLRTRISLKSLKINSKKKYTLSLLRETLRHEIETHFLRKINGMKQRFKVFSLGTAKSFLLEEGLAAVNKRLFLKKPCLYSSAVAVVAADLASRFSSRMTYNQLLDLGIKKEKAFEQSVRSKMGMTKTNTAGVFTKDFIYLEGVQKLIYFLREKPKFDLKNLYLGKIGFWELENLDKIEWQKKGLLLPDFVKSKNYRQKILQIGEFNFL